MAPLPSYISLGINFWHVKRNDYMLYGKYFTSWGVFGLAKKLKWKSFSLIVKYQGLKCKIDYTCILPSNDFQFYPNTERERERERERTGDMGGRGRKREEEGGRA